LELVLFTPLNLGWIFKTTMKITTAEGKKGASLSGPVAEGDHIIKFLVNKLVDTFSPVTADIDANLPHHRHRIWIYLGGLGTSTVCYETLTIKMAEQSLRHLGTGGIMSTNEDDSFFHNKIFSIIFDLNYPAHTKLNKILAVFPAEGFPDLVACTMGRGNFLYS